MHCSLRDFLHDILNKPMSATGSTSYSDGSTWPMPIPFPEVFRAGCPFEDEVGRKRLVSLQVVTLSWLTLDRPASAPSWLRLGVPLTSRQWAAVRNLEHLSFDGNFPEFVDSGLMGRAASKIEGYEDSLAAVSRALNAILSFDDTYFTSARKSAPTVLGDAELACGAIIGEVDYAPDPNAKPLDAGRLQFPSRPSFDPRPFFDARTRELYEHPLQCAKPLDDLPKPPTVKVRASYKAKIELYKKMAAAGMLQPIPEGSFLKDYRSGLFAVPKDSTRDRMVLDARGANIPDPGQNCWCKAMASAASLAGLYIDDEHIMVAGGEDLRDFFYQFIVSEERTRRNVLQGDISLEDAQYIFGPTFSWPSPRVTLGLSTLAMGDCLACEFAQGSHLGLLLQSGVARLDNLLSLHGPVPRGLLQIGVIIDDLVLLEQILKVDIRDDDVKKAANYKSGVLLERARNAYGAAGLENNPKKGFEAETCSSFWGIDLDGKKGLLRCSQKRLWPAIVITWRVCLLRLSTVSLLESLAGVWVSLLGLRRRLYAAMDLVFQPLMMDQKSNAVLRLSDEMVAELASLAILGTLAVVNLRARFAQFVSATDASSSWMAAVRAEVPEQITAEISRQCLRKGVWAKLLPPGRAREREHGVLDPLEELPEATFQQHPFWDALARYPKYSEVWRREIRRKVHINVSELKAFVVEEKRICTGFSSIRYGSGLDSQVALGAIVKGRAASAHLNKVLRTSMAYPIGADVYALPMYYNTAFNRADGPTRNSPPAPPDVKEPEWWDDLTKGNTWRFDRWLKASNVKMPNEDLPYDEIVGHQDLNLQPNSVLKRTNAAVKSVRERKQLPSEPVAAAVECTAGMAWEKGILEPEIVELLRSFNTKQFFVKGAGVPDLTSPGALDLFSGRFGVAKKLIDAGAPWVLTFEWNRGSAENLLEPELRKKILKLVRGKAFLSLSAAPICASFSVAVTPPVRSKRFPRGMPGLRTSMRQKVSEGNSHNDYMRELLEVCEELGIGYTFENPDTSWWWRQRGWKPWRSSASQRIFRFTFCRFGTPWRKATRVATNTRLAGVRMMCKCSKPHVVLRGNHPTRRIPMTLVAQPYPTGLCRLLAVSLAQHAGWCRRERLDVAACSKTGSLRAGEAANPGPRQRGQKHHRQGSLFDFELLSANTLALEAKQLKLFVDWCQAFMPGTPLDELLDKVPEFGVNALVAYAEYLYATGGALSNLRHVILAVQRWKPGTKPFLGGAWEMVERWELVSPVKHRTPVPEAIVQAMCAVAWNLKWFSWIGATLLAFYGAGRLGEVLRCSREDLVLPGDVLEQAGSPIFLRLRSFKSKLRQPAKVQHMKVSDPHAVAIIVKIFAGLDYDSPLFNASPYQYRKRWDALLGLLAIPKTCQLTPGGLRGGAAVYHYKRGRPIQDLLWLLRLRSVATLEYYLQEVAALNSFSQLPPSVRSSILMCASLFAFLTAGDGFSQGSDKLRS